MHYRMLEQQSPIEPITERFFLLFSCRAGWCRFHGDAAISIAVFSRVTLFPKMKGPMARRPIGTIAQVGHGSFLV